MRVPILMYHGVEATGLPGPESPRWDRAYAVTEKAFLGQSAALARSGIGVIDLAEVVAGRLVEEPHAIVLTFDDGYASDVAVVLPALRTRGWRATFFVESGAIGERGRLSQADLRALVEAGMSIGSHTVTHRLLADLSDAEVCRELIESKRYLEDMTGAAVSFLSVPGGSLDHRTLWLAQECGYRAVCTSVPGTSHLQRPGYYLPRLCVRRATSLAAFEQFVRADPWRIAQEQFRYQALQGLRALLGELGYRHVRDSILDRRAQWPGVKTHG